MKNLYTLIFLFVQVFVTNASAQGLHLGRERYTSTGFTVYNVNSGCYGSELKPYVNGNEMIGYNRGFCDFGICKFDFPFGTLNVGDVLTIRDQCGNTSNAVTILDDYVYVEVPQGSSYSGNGIGPTDETPPFARLSTPVQVGKCESVRLNSHALHELQFLMGINKSFDSNTYTSGVLKINGARVNAGNLLVDNSNDPTNSATVNSDGSIQYTGTVNFTSTASFSGRVPFSFEYQHNGVLPFNVQEFTMGPLGFRMWNNGQITIKEYRYDGSVIQQDIYRDITNSTFLITFNSGEFKLFIDNENVKTIARSVIYSSSSGGISNTGLLTYATQVEWSPSASGSHWVQAIMDGVRVVRQKFQVAEDMVFTEAVTNVSCNGGLNGSIQVTVSGGKSPYLYSLDNGTTYQSGNIFNGLSAGDYTINVRDASGCETQKSTQVLQNSPLTLNVSSKTDATCAGFSDGSVNLSASGGAGFYQYKVQGGVFGNSSVINGLAPGVNTLVVKDAAGCEVSTETQISTQSSIGIAAEPASVACFGQSTGGISVSLSGAAAGIPRFSLDNISYQENSSFSGLAAGNYTVYVKDNLCLVSKTDVGITQPADLLLNASVSQVVSCHGLQDGELYATPSGGVALYEFSLDGISYTPAQVSGRFSGLAAGNFKLWVRDLNGCTKDEVLTVNQPEPLTVSLVSKQDASCFGGFNGQLNLAVSGGNAGVSFEANGSVYSSSPISGLPAGVFSVIARDTKGCRDTTSAEILQPERLILAPSVTATVSCNGGNNGELIMAAQGGVPPYGFSLGGTFQTSGSFTGLVAGIYTGSVTDAHGCRTDSSGINLLQPSLILPEANVNHVKCFHGRDGQINASADGGVGGYQYSLDGASYVSNPSFGSLITGNYTLFVRDANSCIQSIQVQVNQPDSLMVGLQKVRDVLCYEGNTGRVQAAARGGTAPYVYSLNGAGFQDNSFFDSLYIGGYQVTVRDANGCVNVTGVIQVEEPTDMLFSIATQKNVSCFGGGDAEIVVNATGGFPGYLYSKSGGTFEPSPVFAGLSQGDIPFQVKDVNGCIKTLSAEITQPSQPYTIGVVSATNLVCHEDNTGIIEVTNSGGTGPYTSWIALDTLYQTHVRFENLTAGIHQINGKDALGCTAISTPVTLTQPTPIHISLLEKTDVDCDHYSRGQARFLATGSNGGFTYSLAGYDFQFRPFGPETRADGYYEQLKAGDYTLTATDVRGCRANQTLTIVSKNSTINFDLQTSLPSDCLTPNGTVTVSDVSGGRPPYSYSISSQYTVSSSPVFSGLLNGTYIVTVSDSLCSYDKEANLSLPSSLNAQINISPIHCEIPDATLAVTGTSGGNGNYEYSLNGGAFQGNGVFTPISPNIYALTIKDNPLSCQTVKSTKVLEQNRAGLEFTERTHILCHGFATGVIEVRGTNNLQPFQYALNGFGFGASGRFAGLSAGEYRIYAKNSIGCIDSLRALLTQPTALLNTTITNDNLCFGDSTGNFTVSGSGGVGPYQFSVDNSGFQTSGQFNGFTAGNYTSYVKDANACVTPHTLVLLQPADILVQPQYADTVRCHGESNGVVQVLANGGTPGYSFSKDGVNYFPGNNFRDLPAGDYTFYVKDDHQCIRRKDFTLTQPDSLRLSLFEKTNPLCFEGADGSINVQATGGNGGNLFILNGQQTKPWSVFEELKQGVYHIRVTDRRGCTAEVSGVELKHPTALRRAVSLVQPLCFGDYNGRMKVETGGGTPGYELLVDGVKYTPDSLENFFHFKGLAARTYQLVTIDKNACEDRFEVKLEQPTRLLSDVNLTKNLCFGDSTGTLHIVPKGATAPYRFSLLNSYRVNDSTFNGQNYYDSLTAGPYIARLKDANNCRYDTLVTILQPDKLLFTASLADSVRCFGEANGKIAIKASGGTPGYLYSLDNLNFGSTDTLKGLKAGVYPLYVKDKNACLSKQEIFEVLEPPKLDLTVSGQHNPLCAGEANGKIELAAAGGNGRYEFIRDNSVKNREGLFENLSQGIYTFKLKDWKGCEDTVSRVNLRWPEALAVQVVQESPTCFGASDGRVSVMIKGGTPGYTSKLIGLNKEYEQTPDTLVYNNLSAGNYKILVNDLYGCELLLSARVNEADKLNGDINLAADLRSDDIAEVCSGQIIYLDAQNPGQYVRWFKDGLEIFDWRNVQTPEASEEGVYSVQVANSTGCTIGDTVEVRYNQYALKADFLIPTQAFVGDTVVCLDITRPIPHEVLWFAPDQGNILSENFSKLEMTFDTEGSFVVEMLASIDGCENLVSHKLQILTNDDLGNDFPKENILSIQVRPNPNNGKFSYEVRLRRAEPLRVELVQSTSGRLIYSKETEKEASVQDEVAISVAPGVYLLYVRTRDEIQSKRILINL